MTDTRSSAALPAAQVRGLLESNPGALVVDVRTPGEFEGAHIDGAVNIPLNQVDGHLRRIVSSAGGQLVLVCQSGARAAQAADMLSAAGLSDVVVLDGGMNAWVAAGGPVERSGRERWALERQVRLVAGSIVAVSVLISFWLPGAQVVAGLIGAGLTFAALSNTCAMGMLLSKLPYNRGTACDIDDAIARLAR